MKWLLIFLLCGNVCFGQKVLFYVENKNVFTFDSTAYFKIESIKVSKGMELSPTTVLYLKVTQKKDLVVVDEKALEKIFVQDAAFKTLGSLARELFYHMKNKEKDMFVLHLYQDKRKFKKQKYTHTKKL